MKLIYLICLILISSSSQNIIQSGIQEVDHFISTLESFFIHAAGKIEGFLFNIASGIESGIQDLACDACTLIVKGTHTFLYQKYGIIVFQKIFELICYYKINNDFHICEGYINNWTDPVLNNLIDKYFNSKFVCGSEYICNNRPTYLNADDFAKKLLANKPAKIEKKFQTDSKKLVMLQMADIHIDLKYQIGSAGVCGKEKTLCCRNEYGTTNNPLLQAKKYGFVGLCDIPKDTVVNFLDHVQNVVKPDLIIWTGDAPSHDMWADWKEEAMEVISFVTHEMKKRLNVSIYPALGNHEFFPIDNYNYFDHSQNAYVFKQTGDNWKSWIGEEAFEFYLQNGFYTKKHFVDGKETNLRIIALNTMGCDSLNFNVIRNPTDPANQFEWLVSELENAEKLNEVVYIIGHIPPGSTTYTKECSLRYNAILDRFENIIYGQFFGHTHYDEFKTHKDYFNRTEVISIDFIAPSITTWPNRLPEFRTFVVDSNTFVPYDYYQYYFNLTKVNENPSLEPEWELLYQATKEFNVTSLLDFEGFKNYIQLLKEGQSEAMNRTIFRFFGMASVYEQYKNNKNVSFDLGCRFEKDIFDDYMKCVNFNPWNSETDNTYYKLEQLSGKWYNDSS